MLEACCATSVKQICCHVTRTKNPGSFWKRYYQDNILINKTLMTEGPSHIIIRVATIGMYRYWMSMEELLKEVGMQGGEEWWPWTTSHIHSGDMERSFLNHLLSADTQVQAINTYNNIHVLHVSIVIYMYNWSYRLSLSPFPPSVFFLPVCLWTDTK